MNAVDTSLTDHANALAYVTKAVADLDEARATILQLRADLHRCEDRLEMVDEDRTFWRDQANAFRSLLVKLSTHQATIGLETIAAQAVVMKIDEAINTAKANTPALEVLEQEFAKGNNEAA